MYTIDNYKPLLIFIRTEFRLTNKPIQNVRPTREDIMHIELDRLPYTNYGTRYGVCINIIIIILYTVVPA